MFDVTLLNLNPIEDGLSGAAHGWRAKKVPLFSKLCRTYPTMMKLATVIHYLKNIQKIYKSSDTPLDFHWHLHFFTGNQQLLLCQEKQLESMTVIICFNA